MSGAAVRHIHTARKSLSDTQKALYEAAPDDRLVLASDILKRAQRDSGLTISAASAGNALHFLRKSGLVEGRESRSGGKVEWRFRRVKVSADRREAVAAAQAREVEKPVSMSDRLKNAAASLLEAAGELEQIAQEIGDHDSEQTEELERENMALRAQLEAANAARNALKDAMKGFIGD